MSFVEENDNSLYKAILDSLFVGICIVDRRETILYWNTGASRLTGFCDGDVLGKEHGAQLIARKDLRGAPQPNGPWPLSETLADSVTRTEKLFLLHKAGHWVALQVIAQALQDETGEMIGVLETFYNIGPELTANAEVERLKQLSMKCPLLGIGNRRYGELMLHVKFEEARRVGLKLGLLYMDVDHFKQINDAHGHEAGDQVLRTLADTLAISMRAGDVLARWGGEEFVAILPDISQEQLEQFAERIRQRVAACTIPLGEHNLSVTISIGAIVAELGHSVEDALLLADSALYQCKAQGRNRVIMAEAATD